MKKFAVTIALEGLREARETWGAARTEFMAGYDVVLRRLIHEGVNNFMSASEIASALGVSTKTVRAKMRSLGLDPKKGKRVLSDQAAKALVGNAELLGIDPHRMDLMSPLAYLPMGSVLKKQLQEQQVSGVTELEGEKCNYCRLNDTWVDDHCTNPGCQTNLEDRLYQAIIAEYEGMGEAWTTDESGDTLARAAARVAAREVSGNLQ